MKCRNCDSPIEKDEELNLDLENEELKLKFVNLELPEALENRKLGIIGGSSIEIDEQPANFVKQESERGSAHLGQIQQLSPSLDLHIGWPGQGVSRSFTMPSGLKRAKLMNKGDMIEIATKAMAELTNLLETCAPCWVKSPVDGRYILDHDRYSKIFSRLNHFGKFSRIESSKDGDVVALSASTLVDMFMDSDKWVDLFPTIVAEGRTIEVLDTAGLGDNAGSLRLVYEKLHILSPRVAPRELYLLRYCKRLQQDKYILVEVSYDYSGVGKGAPSFQSWRLPSGCLIEDKFNGCSEITWMEHVEVDGDHRIDDLYRDILAGDGAYGAKRWIVTLKRMSERLQCFAETSYHGGLGAIVMPEMRKNVMDLSHRMLKSFMAMLSMSGDPLLKLRFENGVDVSIYRSIELGQASSLILGVASSVWLPLPRMSLFNFLKDEKTRAQWDVLFKGNPGSEIAHISCGTLPGNRISIIRTPAPDLMILQESCTDALGSLVVYGPIEALVLFGSVMKGKHPENMSLLPSGFVISDDGRPNKGSINGASTSLSSPISGGGGPGSILTAAVQVSTSLPWDQLMYSAVKTASTLTSSIVDRIRIALGCPIVD